MSESVRLQKALKMISFVKVIRYYETSDHIYIEGLTPDGKAAYAIYDNGIILEL